MATEEEALRDLEPNWEFADQDEEEAYQAAVDTVLVVQRDARHLQRRHAEARGIINDIKRNRGDFKDRQQQ